MRRRLAFLVLVPFALVAIGTTGYRVIEGWAAFDALYMTVITLTTVGFTEVHALSPAGRVFTMFLALGGVFTLFYTATEVIRLAIGGELSGLFGRQKMERTLSELKEHTILCGYGRMGRQVAAELAASKQPFVILDRDETLVAEARERGLLAFVGDASSDETLRRAGVDRARALVAVLGTNADNLYLTMTARLLNDRVFIVSRGEDEAAEQKLLRAGASRVVSPYVTAGQQVAGAVLRPTVIDFLDLATGTQHLDLQIEEARIEAKSALAGSTPKQSRIRQEFGLILVAIKKPAGKMLFNPGPDDVMEAGDILIALGGPKGLAGLKAAAAGE